MKSTNLQEAVQEEWLQMSKALNTKEVEAGDSKNLGDRRFIPNLRVKNDGNIQGILDASSI